MELNVFIYLTITKKIFFLFNDNQKDKKINITHSPLTQQKSFRIL